MKSAESGFSSPPPRSRRRRRWRRKIAGCLAAMVLGLSVVVLGFPWILSTAAGRDWLLARVNEQLAPNRIEARTVSFSWFGPTDAEGLVLRGADGRAMAETPRARWDRRLGQILFDRPNYGELDLGAVSFNVERGSDGRVNLYEAVRPLFTGNPRLAIRVRSEGGAARLHDAGLGLSVDASRSRFDLTLKPSPEPMVWSLDLERDDGGSLRTIGSYDRWRPGEDSALGMTIAARSWPASWSRAWRSGKTLDASARLTGDVAFDLAEFSGSAAFEDLSIRSFGLELGPTTASARIEPGAVHFEPIDAPLNHGRARLLPSLVRDPDRGWIARLGPDSRLDQVRIDDEVARQVLAYAAPVLEKASRARGRVSAQIRAVNWPLRRFHLEDLEAEGTVVFKDVEFLPGGLAERLLGLMGRDSGLRLTLNQPVSLRIANREIRQSGLVVGLGPLARLEMDGTIGFDRSLDLRARLPLDETPIGRNRLTAKLAAGTSVEIPIRGTFDRPRIDGDAFKAGLKDMGEDMIRRSALRGAMNALRRLNSNRE